MLIITLCLAHPQVFTLVKILMLYLMASKMYHIPSGLQLYAAMNFKSFKHH